MTSLIYSFSVLYLNYASAFCFGVLSISFQTSFVVSFMNSVLQLSDCCVDLLSHGVVPVGRIVLSSYRFLLISVSLPNRYDIFFSCRWRLSVLSGVISSHWLFLVSRCSRFSLRFCGLISIMLGCFSVSSLSFFLWLNKIEEDIIFCWCFVSIHVFRSESLLDSSSSRARLRG